MFIYKIIMIITMFVFLIVGCADLEVRPGKHSNLKNAPINESSRPGIVSYSKEAWQEEVERQEAYDTMSESCNGKYKILKEEVKRGAGDYLTDKDYVLGLDKDRVYITFVCVNHD